VDRPLTPAESLQQSCDDFDKLIRPVAEVKLDGRFDLVENMADEMKRALDIEAGVDLWLVQNAGGIRGVASRVQRGKNWRTFTIRKERRTGVETEYAKRREALENELLYPALTLHGYVTSDGVALLGFGVAQTRDLIAMIEQHQYDDVKMTREDRNDGIATFYVISWDNVRDGGYYFIEHAEPPPAAQVHAPRIAVHPPQLSMFDDAERARLIRRR
jgi:hypothetical protein